MRVSGWRGQGHKGRCEHLRRRKAQAWQPARPGDEEAVKAVARVERRVRSLHFLVLCASQAKARARRPPRERAHWFEQGGRARTIVRTENIPKEAPKKSKYGDVEMRDADDDADEADEPATATMTLSDSEVGDEVGEVDVADSSAETMKGVPTLEMYENEMKRLKEREEKLKKKMFAMRPDVNYETMAEVEEGWLLSGSRPDPRASERTGPRVMYSANPKYRIRTADGKYVIPETVDSTAGPRPEVILDDFDNPAGEKPGTKMTKRGATGR